MCKKNHVTGENNILCVAVLRGTIKETKPEGGVLQYSFIRMLYFFYVNHLRARFKMFMQLPLCQKRRVFFRAIGGPIKKERCP